MTHIAYDILCIINRKMTLDKKLKDSMKGTLTYWKTVNL